MGEKKKTLKTNKTNKKFKKVAAFSSLLAMTLQTTSVFASESFNSAISAGDIQSLAVTKDGTMIGWGFSYIDALADPYTRDSIVRANNYVAVATGAKHAITLRDDGTVWAYGYNTSGQIGDGTYYDRYPRVQVLDNAVAVDAFGDTSLAIKSDGSLWGWGDSGDGELGLRTVRLLPYKLMDNVKCTSTTDKEMYAVKNDGTVWHFGDTYDAYLKGLKDDFAPQKLDFIKDVSLVATNRSSVYFVKKDGTLWAVGENEYGQLGDGTTTYREKPVKIMSDVVTVSANNENAYAIKSDGTLWAWGKNEKGTLGNGADYMVTKPVKIMSSVSTVAAGKNHSVAVKKDGTLWAWGKNENGRIGDGTKRHAYYPVQIHSNYTYQTTKPKIEQATPVLDTVTGKVANKDIVIDGKEMGIETFTANGTTYVRVEPLTDRLGFADAKYKYLGREDRENNQVFIKSIDKFTYGDDKTVFGHQQANETAKAVAPEVYVDDTEVLNMTVYNVNGEYFYKITELGNVLGYDVGYDDVKKAITLDSREDKH